MNMFKKYVSIELELESAKLKLKFEKPAFSRFIMSVQDPTYPGGGKMLVLICLYCSNCTKFAQLISGKSLKLLPPDARF